MYRRRAGVARDDGLAPPRDVERSARAPVGVVATTVSFPDDVEPARSEWALAGTEGPHAGARLRRAPHPHAGDGLAPRARSRHPAGAPAPAAGCRGGRRGNAVARRRRRCRCHGYGAPVGPDAGSPHDRAGRRSRRGARSGRDRRTRGCGRGRRPIPHRGQPAPTAGYPAAWSRASSGRVRTAAPRNSRNAAAISSRAGPADRIISTAGTDVWICPRHER